MYMDFTVKVPAPGKGITRKTIKGSTYIYYTFERNYNSERKSTVPKKVISIDDKIIEQKQIVSKAKSKYESELATLNDLMKNGTEFATSS